MTGESTPSMRFTLLIAGFMSVYLCGRSLDDRRPARDLDLEHPGHVLRAAGNEVVAEIGHALDEFRRPGCFKRRPVEPGDDVLRRRRGHHQAEPDARFIASDAGFGNGG